MTTSVHLPGRLGDPSRTLATDDRADPRMVAVLESFGLTEEQPSPVTAESSVEDILAFVKETEIAFQALFTAMFASLAPVPGVTSRRETIRGVDDNEITLYIHEPAERNGPLPCIVHTHGGGMVLLTAADACYVRARDELAATGLVVVGVEFRNGGGSLGPHPFPAGLNDCGSATRWVADHRDELGVTGIVVSGESGGGNLAAATALLAKRDGWVDEIAGVYAQCPYVSGLYADPPAELQSLTENAGYFLDVPMLGALARVYDPDGANSTNPLAWPLRATADDVRGLPPHVVSLNELDPLRDEGLAYYRTLLAGGVPTASRTVNGTCHAGDCLFREAMPDVYAATVRDIKGFADSVSA
jgi:acetyl esterase